MRFYPGDRVHYVVYPSGTPDTRTVGTVTKVDGPDYYVQWDDVDYDRYKESIYLENDLALVTP